MTWSRGSRTLWRLPTAELLFSETSKFSTKFSASDERHFRRSRSRQVSTRTIVGHSIFLLAFSVVAVATGCCPWICSSCAEHSSSHNDSANIGIDNSMLGYNIVFLVILMLEGLMCLSLGVLRLLVDAHKVHWEALSLSWTCLWAFIVPWLGAGHLKILRGEIAVLEWRDPDFRWEDLRQLLFIMGICCYTLYVPVRVHLRWMLAALSASSLVVVSLLTNMGPDSGGYLCCKTLLMVFSLALPFPLAHQEEDQLRRRFLAVSANLGLSSSQFSQDFTPSARCDAIFTLTANLTFFGQDRSRDHFFQTPVHGRRFNDFLSSNDRNKLRQAATRAIKEFPRGETLRLTLLLGTDTVEVIASLARLEAAEQPNELEATFLVTLRRGQQMKRAASFRSIVPICEGDTAREDAASNTNATVKTTSSSGARSRSNSHSCCQSSRGASSSNLAAAYRQQRSMRSSQGSIQTHVTTSHTAPGVASSWSLPGCISQQLSDISSLFCSEVSSIPTSSSRSARVSARSSLPFTAPHVESSVQTEPPPQPPATEEIGVNTSFRWVKGHMFICQNCSKPPKMPGMSTRSLSTLSSRRSSRTNSPCGSDSDSDGSRFSPRTSRSSRGSSPRPRRPSNPIGFDGAWILDEEDHKPQAWLSHLVIQDKQVLVGDGTIETLKPGMPGEYHLCGGRLMLTPEGLLRRFGKSGRSLNFRRAFLEHNSETESECEQWCKEVGSAYGF